MNPQVNKILSRLGKAEKTELKSEKVELASERVELALIDDINSAVEKTLKELKGIKSLISQAEKAAGENFKRINNLQSDFKKINSITKELGLDMPKEVDKNFKMANELNFTLKNVLKGLGTARSSL
tara:strand:- start:221 stop:598 length:378 start_codon:yes stop_codon:yes gene_type:complete